MKDKKPAIIAVSLAVSLSFVLIFTDFEIQLNSQDVVNGDEVFVTTDQRAIDKFLSEIENDVINSDIEQAFGIGIFVDFKDSNGNIIPQDSNFLKIPLTSTSVTMNTDSLVGNDGELLDFAKIQFDVTGITTQETKLQVSADYEILSNDKVFLTGTIYGSGNTINNKLNLDFQQGTKTGNALELSFEKNEIPVIVGSGSPKVNTLDFRITSVEAIVGESFDTEQYLWIGSFPVYSLSYEADDQTRTIRDFTGKAIQTLPNNIGIQVCGNDFGRWGGLELGRNAPTITVKDLAGVTVMVSSPPSYGNRDADFNSYKCGNISTGLERETTYLFNGQQVTTPNAPILYKAECKVTYVSPTYKVICTDNFGGNT